MRLLSKKKSHAGKRGAIFPFSRTALSFIGILFSHCDHDLYVRVLLSTITIISIILFYII